MAVVLLPGEPLHTRLPTAINFEFVIYLQTARILGIEMPPTVLAIVDKGIQ